MCEVARKVTPAINLEQQISDLHVGQQVANVILQSLGRFRYG
jgi:hypothetical protein